MATRPAARVTAEPQTLGAAHQGALVRAGDYGAPEWRGRSPGRPPASQAPRSPGLWEGGDWQPQGRPLEMRNVGPQLTVRSVVPPAGLGRSLASLSSRRNPRGLGGVQGTRPKALAAPLSPESAPQRGRRTAATRQEFQILESLAAFHGNSDLGPEGQEAGLHESLPLRALGEGAGTRPAPVNPPGPHSGGSAPRHPRPPRAGPPAQEGQGQGQPRGGLGTLSRSALGKLSCLMGEEGLARLRAPSPKGEKNPEAAASLEAL